MTSQVSYYVLALQRFSQSNKILSPSTEMSTMGYALRGNLAMDSALAFCADGPGLIPAVNKSNTQYLG